jgi:hypothetical protein
MIVNYSRTMPVADAVRMTFTADSLCGVCEFVADTKTRADATLATSPTTVKDPLSASADSAAAKGKLLLATAPTHFNVYCSSITTAWPTEQFLADACARPAPPVEPPRAA